MNPQDRADGQPGAQWPGRTPARRRELSLYTLLTALPLLVLLPVLLFSAYLLFLFSEQTRISLHRQLGATNVALSTLIDREVAQVHETLAFVGQGVLGAGPGSAQAKQLLGTAANSRLGLETVAVISPDGTVLARYPEGAGGSAQIELEPAQREALFTGRFVLSGLDGSRGRPTLTANQAVAAADGTVAVVSAQLSPDHFATLMQDQLDQRGAIGTLLDQNHRMMARTHDPERFVGRLPSQETLAAFASAPSGIRRFPTLDGNDYLWAWSTLGTGWNLMVGVPAFELQESLRRSVRQLVEAGVVLLLISVAATMLMARRITRSVDRMEAGMHDIAGGNVAFTRRRSGIRQMDRLYDALVDAGRHVAQLLAAEREARLAADESNRQKDVFIATLSHELRNPLAPIRAAGGVLRTGRVSADRIRPLGDMVERNVSALARLLDDLLDLSRVNTGRIELRRARVVLQATIASAVETVRPLFDAVGHQLAVELPAEDIVLEGDHVRLVQVFANLLANAAKYTDAGGSIAVVAQVLGPMVQVRVSDNGIGLAPADAERIFGRFEQVRDATSRAQGGLGIGLALVRSLVEMHGGRAWASSAGLGQGSTFFVELPVLVRATHPPGDDVPAAEVQRVERVDRQEAAADRGLM